MATTKAFWMALRSLFVKYIQKADSMNMGVLVVSSLSVYLVP